MFSQIFTTNILKLNRTDLINMKEGQTAIHFETNEPHKSISKLPKT